MRALSKAFSKDKSDDLPGHTHTHSRFTYTHHTHIYTYRHMVCICLFLESVQTFPVRVESSQVESRWRQALKASFAADRQQLREEGGCREG